MKSNCLRTTSLASVLGLLGLFDAGLASRANASSFVLEPGLGGIMESNILNNSPSAGTTLAPQFEMRAAYEIENLFSSIDARVNLVDIQGVGNTGIGYALGLSGGGIFYSIPIRILFGLDFIDSYGDGSVTLGGSAFHMTGTYYLSPEFALNLNFVFNNYTSVAFAATSKSSTAAVSAGQSSIGISVSMPFYLDPPSGAWRPPPK